MKVIIGLGNPGARYEKTRHNVGVMVAQLCAKKWRVPFEKTMGGSQVAQGTLGLQPIRLALPKTFMNLSGQGVKGLAQRWRLKASDLLVVCDDVRLPLGTIRLRAQGSDGGHHGLTSIFSAMGTQEVPRLRVGIGSSQLVEDLKAYVLDRFEKDEAPLLQEGLEQAVKACEVWAEEGLTTAMNRFNKRTK